MQIQAGREGKCVTGYQKLKISTQKKGTPPSAKYPKQTTIKAIISKLANTIAHFLNMLNIVMLAISPQ